MKSDGVCTVGSAFSETEITLVKLMNGWLEFIREHTMQEVGWVTLVTKPSFTLTLSSVGTAY
jgi:hypothetical protein